MDIMTSFIIIETSGGHANEHNYLRLIYKRTMTSLNLETSSKKTVYDTRVIGSAHHNSGRDSSLLKDH